MDEPNDCGDDLGHFSQMVNAVSQYGEFRRLTTLNYNVDTGTSLSIVSRLVDELCISISNIILVSNLTRMVNIL